MLQKYFLNHNSYYSIFALLKNLHGLATVHKLNIRFSTLFDHLPPPTHTHTHNHRHTHTRNIHYYHLTSSSSSLQGNLSHLARSFSNAEIFPHPLSLEYYFFSLFPYWMSFISLQGFFICHILHPIMAISVIALSAQLEYESLENRSWFLIFPTKEGTMSDTY